MSAIKESPEQSIRTKALEEWLEQQMTLLPQMNPESQFVMSLVSGDASFRRYFRIQVETGDTPAKTYIAVDAPPEHENSEQFCKVAALLLQAGCFVPEVLASDFKLGFMLLSDLGDRQLLSELNEGNVEQYYALAFEQLIKMQRHTVTGEMLPLYSHDLLMTEMSLFQEWFLKAFLKMDVSESMSVEINAAEQRISEQLARQTQVFVHRDFHSRNLMIVEESLAMIDFQDAVVGPVTYDAVSLLKDCYIEWSEAQRRSWLQNYYTQLLKQSILNSENSFEQFYLDFELMGLQRHLKVLGIFARLSIRDGKHGYLRDLPLTFRYVEEVLEKFGFITEFGSWFISEVKPVFEEKMKRL